MRVRYEVKLTFEVEEEPDNPFPIDACAEALRMEDAPGVMESRVETTRTEVG